MILPGIYASQISGHLFTPTGNYTSIATATVDSSGASSITFSSIPQGYQHLQIRLFAKGTSGSDGGTSALVQFNGDTTSGNYYTHQLYGDGSTAYSNVPGSGTSLQSAFFAAGLAGTNVFGVAVIDILDYTNTNKYKTVRTLTGYDSNGSSGGGYAMLRSGLWLNSSALSAINSITITSGTANFGQYSQISLYGVK